MPVYNNEKTLKTAIESILNQTIYGLELILVNDGSTDTSSQICDEYARKEPLLVEVIHQKKQGLATARNKGLLNSSGKYVYFADPTDRFDPRMLQSNIKLANEKEADLVVFGFTSVNSEGKGEVKRYLPRMPILSDQEDFRNHYRNFHKFYPYVLFNKIYRRRFLVENRLKFHNLPLMEETFFNLKIFKEISSVVFNRKALCHRSNIATLISHPYEENLFTIYMEFINSLETIFKYWDTEDEYVDLIVEEYYQALIIEMHNVTSLDSPLSIDQQAKRMTEVLSSGLIQEKLNKVKHSTSEKWYNRLLLSHFQNGDGAGALDLMRRQQGATSAKKLVLRLIKKMFRHYK